MDSEPPTALGSSDDGDATDAAPADVDGMSVDVRNDRHDPSDSPSEVARPNRRMRTATVLTIPALLALAASAALFLVPVANPGVQDCGSPAWFLLQARADRPLVTDEGGPLHGWGQARLRQAHQDRCSAQVATRAVPAGALLVVFWVLALVAVVIGWNGRRGLRRTSTADRR